MYSRSKRGNNYLHESGQEAQRARREADQWRHDLETQRSVAAAGGGVVSGTSVADAARDTFRRFSRTLRRKWTAPESASSGLLPDSSLGPLASAVRFNSINEDDVVRFLSARPDVLNNVVDEYVDVPTIKMWLASKTSAAVRSHAAPAQGSVYGSTSGDQLRHRLLDEASHPDHAPQLVHELARLAAVAVHADAFTLYLIDDHIQELKEYTPGRDDFVKHNNSFPIGNRATPSALAAATGEAILVETITNDPRFLVGFGPNASDKDRSGLVVPLPGLAVVELRRGVQHEPFEHHHLEVVNAILAWFNIAISKIQLSEVLQHQEELNSFLLEVAESLFEDVFAQETLVSKIMIYAKSLVSAERVTFFTLEDDKQELVASLFDDGQTRSGAPVLSKRPEIRFPVERGIAGYCARTGHMVNVQDAYADPRFNPDVDRKTGYRSRGLLAYPVKAKGRLLGVLQVVNKIGGDFFTAADEAAIRMFGIYCSLALYYGIMHDRSQKKEHQLSVCLDMLEYHSTASPEELRPYFDQPLPSSVPTGFDTFGWSPGSSHSLVRLYIHMFFELARESRTPPENIVTFTATVVKCYRRVPYHNALHGFMVAHAMYNILKRNATLFSKVELLALLVACIAHDVDHRGYSNTFAKSSTALGSLYRSSVLENHHYATMADILQRPGHDVLAELQPQERREAMQLMYEAIIATDLAIYFQRRPRLEAALKENQFSLHDRAHRRLFFDIMMTGCDLSAVLKPPEVVVDCTLKLYIEFHEQGDNERRLGLTPDSMMDRAKAMNLPKDQINFVKYLCMPAYDIIVKVLPNCSEMLTNIKRTLSFWEAVQQRDSSTWKPYPSWPSPVSDQMKVAMPAAARQSAERRS